MLRLTGRHELLLFRGGLTNHPVVVRLPLADQSLAGALTLGHILLVQLLRQRQDTRSSFVPIVTGRSRC